MEPQELVSGRYRLLRRLGEGGMGEVWSARNERTGREFAIKVLLPSLLHNPEAIERFVREARATARLRHPGIVDVYDAGRSDDGRPYIVMDLLEGESLEERLARERPLAPLTVCVYLGQIARALDVAHRAGIVHRDLSTPNVFLAKNAEGAEPLPKILDFGVMKVTGPAYDGRVRTGDGTVLGSPAYMSPEQAMGAETVDHRTDVWSLGVLLYECLCGVPPFRQKTYNALLLTIVSTLHRPLCEVVPGLDAELVDVVEACLVKDREGRTRTAREVAEQLERIALRLARGESVPKSGPRRRAHERLRPEQALPALRPQSGVFLPPRVLPVGVRVWQAIADRTFSRSVLAAGSAFGGIALGLAIGFVFATSPDGEALAESSRESAPVVLEKIAGRVRVPERRLAALSSGSRHKQRGETDLVRAAARGLGLPAPRARKRMRPAHFKIAPPLETTEPLLADLDPPRDNPY